MSELLESQHSKCLVWIDGRPNERPTDQALPPCFGFSYIVAAHNLMAALIIFLSFGTGPPPLLKPLLARLLCSSDTGHQQCHPCQMWLILSFLTLNDLTLFHRMSCSSFTGLCSSLLEHLWVLINAEPFAENLCSIFFSHFAIEIGTGMQKYFQVCLAFRSLKVYFF